VLYIEWNIFFKIKNDDTIESFMAIKGINLTRNSSLWYSLNYCRYVTFLAAIFVINVEFPLVRSYVSILIMLLVNFIDVKEI
jgi:hypothetical protein